MLEMLNEINGMFNAAADQFSITDDGKAEWAMRKIREAQEEYDRMATHFNAQLTAIAERRESTVSYMTQLLADYFQGVPRHVTKTGIEKYKLPSGELVMKPAGLDYKHEETALLEWCRKEHPEYIKITEKPSWSDVKAYIKSTGEIPDGVMPVETPAKFDVKVS